MIRCIIVRITCDITFDYVKKYVADIDKSEGPRIEPCGTPYLVLE